MKEEILKLYNQGISGTKLAKMFNKDASTIYKYIRQAGGTVKSYSEASQKYSLDKTYFSVINTEEKAYWLGFIYADGCITQGKLSIGLSSVDKNHLVKLKKCLGYNGPLHSYKSNTNKNKTNVSLQISNKTLLLDLKTQGVYPCKTYTCNFPNITNSLYKHFIRGYFDGDGSVGFEKGVFSGISICGNKEFLNSLRDILIKELDITNTKLIYSRNIYVYSKRGKIQATKILKWLYLNNNISLNRKQTLISPLIE